MIIKWLWLWSHTVLHVCIWRTSICKPLVMESPLTKAVHQLYLRRKTLTYGPKPYHHITKTDLNLELVDSTSKLSFQKANNWQWSNIEVGCRCQISTHQRYIHFEEEGCEKGEVHTKADQGNYRHTINKALHCGEVPFCSLMRKMAFSIKIWKQLVLETICIHQPTGNLIFRCRDIIKPDASNMNMNFRRVYSIDIVHESWTAMLVANGYIINCSKYKYISRNSYYMKVNKDELLN